MAPPQPTFTVTPPCTATTATITVTSPLGAQYTYSIDGTNFQPQVDFNNVAPNTYTLTVTDAGTGCSAASQVIVAAAPPVPAVNVTNPTCTVSTGKIEVTSSTAGLLFSLDGGAFATYPAGGYIVGSGPHTITAQNAGLCTSSVNAPVATQPVNNLAIAPVITDAGCTAPTGAITLNTTGGVAPLTFAWTGPGGFTSTTANITALASGVIILQ